MIEYSCPHCRAEFFIGFKELSELNVTKGEGAGVCNACGGWFIFQDDWSTRTFEPEDLLDTDDELLMLMRDWTRRARAA